MKLVVGFVRQVIYSSLANRFSLSLPSLPVRLEIFKLSVPTEGEDYVQGRVSK
jgi:hypothetical protein